MGLKVSIATVIQFNDTKITTLLQEARFFNGSSTEQELLQTWIDTGKYDDMCSHVLNRTSCVLLSQTGIHHTVEPKSWVVKEMNGDLSIYTHPEFESKFNVKGEL